VGSGTRNVIVVFMELCVSHAVCQRPGDVGPLGKLWRCHAFDHWKAVAPRDATGSEMPKVEHNCSEADKGRIALLGAGSQHRDSLLDQVDLVERTY